MKLKNVLFLFAFLFGVIACSISKKNKKATEIVYEPIYNLDTISVSASDAITIKKYQATHSKTNDILHTKLWVSFDWQKSQLIGKAEILIKPYFYPTNWLYLNARGMEIKSLKLFEYQNKNSSPLANQGSIIKDSVLLEKPVTFVYENDSLKVNLGRVYTNKERYIIIVEYIAKPNELKSGGSSIISDDKGLFFINPLGTDSALMPQIWTQGETESNSVWFPTNDNPTEKMTNEIYMTVDDKYTTLSNGLLTESKKNADSTRTDHWEMKLPHAPYLLMMAVGDFKKVIDEPWNGKEIAYYVEKEYVPHAKAIFGKTKKMIEFYSNKLGVAYPWQKYAQLVARNYVSGAMENTSSTLHGDFMVYQTTRETIDGLKGETTIAHELFHQWFGDLVTCESWSNLTLNESFATYGEYLWEEFEYGRDAADDHHNHSRKGYLADEANNSVDLVRFNYLKRDEMFDAHSYNKGGQILHMLRKYVGDDAFFASLKLYLETFKFKTAEAHDLRLVFETVTGEDFNWFFNQWYYGKGHPVLKVTKSFDLNTKKLTVNVLQQQDLRTTSLFKLPINIDVYCHGKKTQQRVWIKDVSNTYIFDIDTIPDLVNIDAERQLLGVFDYEKSKEEFLFQYKNAALWEDRKEAMDYFASHTDDKSCYNQLVAISQNDPWWKFRSEAVELLADNAKGNLQELKPLFLGIYENDKNTNVRASAIKGLSKVYAIDELKPIYESAMNEASYAIVSAGLNALVKQDAALANKYAVKLENETNIELTYAIANLYAKSGLEKNQAYFEKIKPRFTGYELMGYCEIYGSYLSYSKKAEVVLSGAKSIAKIAETDNQYVKYTAKKVLKESLIDLWQAKEDQLKTTIDDFTESNKDASKLKEELLITTDTKKQIINLYNAIN